MTEISQHHNEPTLHAEQVKRGLRTRFNYEFSPTRVDPKQKQVGSRLTFDARCVGFQTHTELPDHFNHGGGQNRPSTLCWPTHTHRRPGRISHEEESPKHVHAVIACSRAVTLEFGCTSQPLKRRRNTRGRIRIVLANPHELNSRLLQFAI